MSGGPYAAIYADLLWHRKVRAIPAGDRLAAFGFYCACCAYCQLNRTDGFIAYEQLVAVFACTSEERNRLGPILIEARLFDRADDGIEIHNYLRHNLSREQIETGKKAQSVGGKKGGIKSGETRRRVPLKATLEGSAVKSIAKSALSEEALVVDPAVEPEGPDRDNARDLAMSDDNDPMPR